MKFCCSDLSSSCHILRLLISSLLLLANCLSAIPHHHLPASPSTNGFQANFHCSSEFVLYEAHCYRYFGSTSRRAFYHAEKQCTHFHSTLVSLLSHGEEEFVVQLTANNTAFWIGLNDEEGPKTRHTEGVFKWTSGEEHDSQVQYQHWKPGEPNNRRHLDCVKVDGEGWAMATGGCAASKLPFVCKKRGRQPPYDTPTYEACPYGLDWDGESCDILVANGDEQYSSHSHWLDSLIGYRTLLLMFLVSLIVSVATLAVKSCSTFNYRKTSQETRTKDNVSTSQNRTKNKSLSRVEDLLHPS